MEKHKKNEKIDLQKKLGEMKFELSYTISSHFRKKTKAARQPPPSGEEPTERTSRGTNDSSQSSEDDAPTLADHRFHAKALHIAQTNLDTIKKMMPIKESERHHFIFGQKSSYKPSILLGASTLGKKEERSKSKAVDFNIECYPELNRRFHGLWTGEDDDLEEAGEAEKNGIRAPD